MDGSGVSSILRTTPAGAKDETGKYEPGSGYHPCADWTPRVNREDLTELLAAWDFRPGTPDVRRLPAADGRPLLQVRVRLGVLQMEAVGRPDGRRPEGFESLLHLHLARLDASPQGSGLSLEECESLRDEAALYDQRCAAWFALQDFPAAEADAARNLQVLDLCRRSALRPEDRVALEPLRPRLVALHARAAAARALAAGGTRAAREAIDAALASLGGAPRDGSPPACPEVSLLLEMREALIPKLPASQRWELVERLRAALRRENYELAAILRDELRFLGGGPVGDGGSDGFQRPGREPARRGGVRTPRAWSAAAPA